MKGYSRYFWFIHFVGDIILINISFLLSYYYKFGSLISDDRYIFLLVIFNFIWMFTAFMLDLYSIRRLKENPKMAGYIIKNLFSSIFRLK